MTGLIERFRARWSGTNPATRLWWSAVAGQLVGKTNADGACTTGTHRDTSYFMLHVWTAPQLAAQYQFVLEGFVKG